MKKLLLVHLGTLFFLQFLYPQIVLKESLSDRLTGYTIDTKLDPATKTVEAKMKAFWVNTSSDVVPDIQLHLYMNAFRSSKTTFNIESGDSPTDKKPEYGWNCHQFHANSEFYSNHSVYDVKITLPKEYIVGSGGMLIDEVDSDGDKKQN